MVQDRSVAPGPGTLIITDAHGRPSIRPWREASTRGRLGESQFVPGGSMPAIAQRMIDTAPKIVKTSGLAKKARMVEMLSTHVAAWRKMLGRPMVVSDLSEEMQRVLFFTGMKADREITPEMIASAASRHLRSAENQMRAVQGKRIAKEAFYVGPGVR